MHRRIRRPQPATAISLLALFVALGGTGYAALKINGNAIKRNTIAGNRLKKNTITGREVREGSLGKVRKAARADAATTADRATTADHATTADTATSATSATTATSATSATSATTATTAETANTAKTADLATNANALGGQGPGEFAAFDIVTFARQASTTPDGELARDATVGVIVNTDSGTADDFALSVVNNRTTGNISGYAQCSVGGTVTSFSDAPGGGGAAVAPCPPPVLTAPSDFTLTVTDNTTLRSTRLDCAASPINGAPLIRCWTLHLKQ